MLTLKYLFTAIFRDGSTVQQTADDTSTLDPAKNAFYDVLQKGIENVELFQFQDADHDTYRVNLNDGSFFVNGATFRAGDPRIQPVAGTEYRLVYFKRHTHRLNAALDELTHEVEYVLGWQATIEGQNIQHSIILT